MINPINTITTKYNKIEYKKEASTNQELLLNNFELADYKTSQTILARNNISFRNSAKPVEVTHLYNKKAEGKDHLDLPNVHVYEFPDTNLRIFVNETNDKTVPQTLIIIEPNAVKYNPLKQALVNKIITKRFQQNNLNNFYDEDIYSHIQFISNSSEKPMNISDIQIVNKILISTQFDKKTFENAKQEIKEYISSEEYSKENLLGKELYKDFLLTEHEVCQMIDDIKLEDLQEYYKDILNNSTMEICLTLNKDLLYKNNILTKINDSIDHKFLKKTPKHNTILNDKTRVLYNEAPSTSLELNYFINNNQIQDRITMTIVQKLVSMYSDFEQNRINKYAENQVQLRYSHEKDQEKQMFYKNMIIRHETEANFINPANYKNSGCVQIPLNIAESNQIPMYGEFCKISLYLGDTNDKVNFNKLINDHYKLLENLLNSDLKSNISKIKTNLKMYLQECLKGEQTPTIKNLETALYGIDSFQIFETIDSITENDVKNYIENYLINQPPIIQISRPKDTYQQTTSKPTFRGYQKNLNHLKTIPYNNEIVMSRDGITQSIKKLFSKNKNTTDLPIISTPIVLYMKTKIEKIKDKLVEETTNVSDKSYTDTYEKSVKALEDAGITGDKSKYINTVTGRLNTTGQNAIVQKKNVASKGSPEEATMPDNIESDLSETESYTNSDIHSGLFENLMNKISEGLENLKEKIVDTIDDIKLEFDIYKDYTLPRDWENFKENMFTKAGEIKENTHNIISNTFKGSNTEIHRYTIRDIAEHPELMDNLSIEEIKQIDVLMCPELEEFLQTPLDEVPDGLMSNILEDLPEGFGVGDETLYETLKGVVENATDMLG